MLFITSPSYTPKATAPFFAFVRPNIMVSYVSLQPYLRRKALARRPSIKPYYPTTPFQQLAYLLQNRPCSPSCPKSEQVGVGQPYQKSVLLCPTSSYYLRLGMTLDQHQPRGSSILQDMREREKVCVVRHGQRKNIAYIKNKMQKMRRTSIPSRLNTAEARGLGDLSEKGYMPRVPCNDLLPEKSIVMDFF